jgi:hypothetical protein
MSGVIVATTTCCKKVSRVERVNISLSNFKYIRTTKAKGGSKAGGPNTKEEQSKTCKEVKS